ncbi:MAG TPA: glycosyltransferase family 4 protein [Candidatus Hydrogenedentes bacterium]|nr:glycosyltransferase family 4 protein [Candidatus Hydrogenedentota bacterium]
MRRIRVAHIITRLCQGGAQENTLHTARLHDRGRYEVDLLCGRIVGGEASIEDKAASYGVGIVRVPDLVRPLAPWRDVRALHQLERLIRKGRYDIVHTHTSKAGYLGRWAAARAGTPIVVHTPHGHVFDGYFPVPLTRLFVRLERRAAKWTDRIIALTPQGVEEHLAEGIGRPDQYVDIFSGIDLEPFEAAIRNRDAMRAALGYGRDEALIGAAGRLEPVKGFAYFVEAARLVCAQAPHARMLLAGRGPLDRVLRAQAADMGDRFRFLGFRDDLPDVLAALDIFVLPSINEGMGRVLLECGAAGVPAVATAVGGVPNIVHDGATGLLTPPRNAQALACNILGLVQDAGLRHRMGMAARGHVAPRYGIETMVRKIESLYEELIRAKSL